MTNTGSQPVAVDCTIDEDGRVWVHRVRLDDRWLPVAQGRQNTDENGRVVLVMLSGGPVRRLRLDRATLRWELSALPGDQNLDWA